MEPVVYNNEFLRHHPLIECCLSTLNTVSERDYPGKNYFNPEIECLDIDTYECKHSHGERGCTADAVIGISACKNKVLSGHRLQIVELRIDFKSPKNLRKDELENKVTHTKELLGTELPVDTYSIFVFSEKVAPQARHWVESQKHEGGEIRFCKAYSVQEFHNNILSVDDIPYVPQYNPNSISEELNKLVDDESWNKLCEKMSFWIKLAGELRYGNIYEYDSLKETLTKWWSAFRANCPIIDDDDELNALIVDEDIETVLK
ncbi:hypothetical protein M1D30_03465 [Prevotella sp. E15-22]|uniref:hypothetical protein n=1 Tax=Prevotella sp. E15-22 TaxID=2937774 RepID=UPI00205EF58E|nr:hypothetical protein [Prevotella sp. E15-22]UPS45242.1 hypothetical protein M1D30_03465 [Prevotella sp. E15-22]